MVFGLGRGISSPPRGQETFSSPLTDQAANRELFEEQVDIIFKHAIQPGQLQPQGQASTRCRLEVPSSRLHVEELHIGAASTAPAGGDSGAQPIQGGTARGLEFMAKHGIQGMVGGGSAEGGAMHKVVLGWQEAHAKMGKHIELGERLCFGFHFYMADSREAGIRKAAKYYEENMKMFGELRLVRALTDEQIEDHAAIRRVHRMPKLPRIEDAMRCGRVPVRLAGTDDRSPEGAGGRSIPRWMRSPSACRWACRNRRSAGTIGTVRYRGDAGIQRCPG